MDRGKEVYMKKMEGKRYVWGQLRNKAHWSPVFVLGLWGKRLEEKLWGILTKYANNIINNWCL